MRLIDLLIIVAAVLIIIWLVGAIANLFGPLLYILLIIAIIFIIARFVFGRRI